MRTFQFSILTPEAEYVRTEAEMVKLHLADGDYVLLAGHEPVTAALDIGLLQYRNAAGELHEVICTDGFVQMTADGAVVFTGECLDADTLDPAQEKQEIDELLAQHRYIQSLSAHHSAAVFMVRALDRRNKIR